MTATKSKVDTKPKAGRTSDALNPVSLLQAAMKAVPSVRYAFGVVGIAAAVSIAVSLLSDKRLALIGISCAFAFMVTLLLFQRLSLLESRHFKLPAVFLLWLIPVLGKTHFADRGQRRHVYKTHINVTAHGDVRGETSPKGTGNVR